MYKGRTSWESSYYGGVKRVLIEYPFFNMNYDIYSKYGKKTKVYDELSLYQGEKLINILFSTALVDTSLEQSFRDRMTEMLRSIMSDPELKKQCTVKSYYGEAQIKIDIDRKWLKQAVNHMLVTELAAIYEYYGSSIVDGDTEVYVMIPEKSLTKPTPVATPGQDSKKDWNIDTAIDNAITRLIKKSTTKDKTNSVEDFLVTVTNVSKTEYPAVITEEQITFAKRLYNLLDISYDPRADTVKNLLQGNLDSEKLAEVLSGNNRVHMRRVEEETIKPFKVIVLGDLSGSMGSFSSSKQYFQRTVMKSLYYLFKDLMKIEDVEFYGHSGDYSPVLYRYHSHIYPNFLETIDCDDIDTEENYDGPVIEYIYQMTRDRTSKAVLLISLSDGEPGGHNYGGSQAAANMKRVMEKLKRDNFVTVGIGMQYMVDRGLYQYQICIDTLRDPSLVSRVINRAVKENLVMED